MIFAIERYVGYWVASSGHRLRIKKFSGKSASVDFLDPSGIPVRRPYCNASPAEGMLARYDDYNGEFDVELWERGRGFTLHLLYEYQYELDEFRREALIPSISRCQEDEFLDRYYPLFGQLKHFIRESNAEPGGRA